MKWTPPGPALLFCPADRPERFAKAAAAADMVILDLEDGVAKNDKQSARHCLEPSELDASRTIVRVNPYGTEDQERDLTALARTSYDIVMLSKTESVEQVLAMSPLRVVALCETPLGILAADGNCGLSLHCGGHVGGRGSRRSTRRQIESPTGRRLHRRGPQRTIAGSLGRWRFWCGVDRCRTP